MCEFYHQNAWDSFRSIMLRSNAPVITAKTGEHDFTGGEKCSSDHFRRWSPQKTGDVQNVPTLQTVNNYVITSGENRWR